MHKKILSASILSADFANLGQETKSVIEAGVDNIHFDVMDHHYVPNLSFGAHVCSALRKAGITVPIDVHLMVEEPERYIEPFAKAGASLITFHPKTVTDVKKTLVKIRNHGMQTGLAFNPDEEVELDKNTLQSLDLILLMSVFPGFGGQAFIQSCFDKIKQTRKLIIDCAANTYLGVDGGIKISNIAEVSQAGADFFVVGSGLFNGGDYKHCTDELRKAMNQS